MNGPGSRGAPLVRGRLAREGETATGWSTADPFGVYTEEASDRAIIDAVATIDGPAP